MPNDLTQVRAEGFFLNPPDTRGNVQRIFVPRSALSALTVLAVIGRRPSVGGKPAPSIKPLSCSPTSLQSKLPADVDRMIQNLENSAQLLLASKIVLLYPIAQHETS